MTGVSRCYTSGTISLRILFSSRRVDVPTPQDVRERRRHVRFSVDDQTYCYLNGSRFDTTATNLSASGAFLETDDQVPIGSVIVLLFDDTASDTPNPVHLVGRVMRHDVNPAGIGVRWLKAVTGASDLDLGTFLAERLHISPEQRRLNAESGRVEYEFDEYVPPTPEQEPKIRSIRDGLTLIHSQKQRRGQLFVVRTDEQIPAVPEVGRYDLHHHDDTGPITLMIRGDQSRFAVSSMVDMTVGRTNCKVMLTTIGRTGCSVQTDIMPGSNTTPILINLPIPTAEGVATVLIEACMDEQIMGTAGAPPLLLLRIENIDETAYPGLFERYLKWLHARDLAGSHNKASSKS